MAPDKHEWSRFIGGDDALRFIPLDTLESIRQAHADNFLRNAPEPTAVVLTPPAAWPEKDLDELPTSLWGIPIKWDPDLRPGDWAFENDPAARAMTRADWNEPSILDEAKAIVKNKARDYGKPADNANRIAVLWGTYLDGKYGKDALWDITADDVCMMMVLLKIARRVQTPSRDSLVDIAGWAAVADEAGEES